VRVLKTSQKNRKGNMKSGLTKWAATLSAALACALTFTSAQAQQYPNPTTVAEVPGPAAGNTMTKEYVQMVGRMAYFWGWPLVATSTARWPSPRRAFITLLVLALTLSARADDALPSWN
jgi:hypothetical protein